MTLGVGDSGWGIVEFPGLPGIQLAHQQLPGYPDPPHIP